MPILYRCASDQSISLRFLLNLVVLGGDDVEMPLFVAVATALHRLAMVDQEHLRLTPIVLGVIQAVQVLPLPATSVLPPPFSVNYVI